MTWGHPRARIDAWLLRLGAGAPDEELFAHLRSCAACRAYFDEGVLALRAARGSATAPGPGELARLEERAAGIAAGPQAVAPRVRPRWLLAAAAAAAALVVVGVVALRGGGPVGTVHTAGKELLVDGAPAVAGQTVRAGAWVEARRGDSTLLLAGKRGVLLREGARARFEDGGAWAVLEAGRARFSVRPGLGPFTVAAGEARIEVRGTVFVVERRADGETLVAVHRGEVRVTGSGAAVTLSEGQETTVARGGVPAPARAVRPGSLEEDRGGDLLELLRRAWQSLVRSLDAEVGP